MSYIPNYKNIVNAALNKAPARVPLYEHIIAPQVMEQVTGKSFSPLIDGDKADKTEYFKHYCAFFKAMCYDTVSFEQCITAVLPGGGALYCHTEPVIKDRKDFEAYPFADMPDIYEKRYFTDFDLLRENMPDGMRAIGGVGNGVFEIVQDLVGYQDLCFLLADDMKLVEDIFDAVGSMMYEIWRRFLNRYSDVFCVMRFGDDLGFMQQTLLPKATIKKLIIPQYKRLVAQVHSFDKPFLMHSCGCIFDLMDTLIDEVGIDAKHSNEDNIAPFSEWVTRYGDRIGNFGGIDMGMLCEHDADYIKDYVTRVYQQSVGHGGFALGSGNSIAEYVPAQSYLAMVETANALRI